MVTATGDAIGGDAGAVIGTVNGTVTGAATGAARGATPTDWITGAGAFATQPPLEPLELLEESFLARRLAAVNPGGHPSDPLELLEPLELESFLARRRLSSESRRWRLENCDFGWISAMSSSTLSNAGSPSGN